MGEMTPDRESGKEKHCNCHPETCTHFGGIKKQAQSGCADCYGANADELLPCPFCGETPEITKHFKEEMYRLVHRCKTVSPFSIDWQDKKDDVIKRWNKRV